MVDLNDMTVEQLEEKASRHHQKAEFYLFRIEQCKIFIQKGFVLTDLGLIRMSDFGTCSDFKKNIKLYQRHWKMFEICTNIALWKMDCALGNTFLNKLRR